MENEERLIINANRDGYSPEQVKTITVGQLMDVLSQFPENAKVYLSHDNGYTYGGIKYSDFNLEE